jgi:hypothetical protein
LDDESKEEEYGHDARRLSIRHDPRHVVDKVNWEMCGRREKVAGLFPSENEGREAWLLATAR